MATIPDCDLCRPKLTPAEYDGKTAMGPWAYMCGPHFREVGVGVGVGRGQKLFTEDV